LLIKKVRFEFKICQLAFSYYINTRASHVSYEFLKPKYRV